MSEFQYSQKVAAIHELGHAAVAWALGLSFSKVEIREDQTIGWVGKCHLIENALLTQVEIEAFNLAGPIAQTIMAPKSLGRHLALFESSLFAESFALCNDSMPIKDLFWGSDFLLGPLPHGSQLHLCALGISSGTGNAHKPYLLELENALRAFLGHPEVRHVIEKLVVLLADEKELSGDLIIQFFGDGIGESPAFGLVELVRANRARG